MRGSRKAAIQGMLEIACATDTASMQVETDSGTLQETPQIKSLVKLSNWLCADLNTSVIMDSLGTTVEDILGGTEMPPLANDEASRLALACFCRATAVMPGLPKSWLRYGAWCFRQGRSAWDDSPTTLRERLTKQMVRHPHHMHSVNVKLLF